MWVIVEGDTVVTVGALLPTTTEHVAPDSQRDEAESIVAEIAAAVVALGTVTVHVSVRRDEDSTVHGDEPTVTLSPAPARGNPLPCSCTRATMPAPISAGQTLVISGAMTTS